MIKKFEQFANVTCHICKNIVKNNESFTISIDSEFFGVKGWKNILICKECHREHQLSKLI